ncbi:response regulator transcription factor [Microbulbifer salipaludis]|uniref:Response regulator transcription factor n=1 Tax=Microbulbifer salipaludis TaxID=187980 RepID=A0ABS3E6P5_9GAMM|nr:LytTR family DNA-binding domain-containing protein [Microbulbifer salipaludis]MBN8430986.1 response regulator transcription factor [Microbulbifer salipaludis]
MSQLRAVLVDDEPLALQLLQSMLEEIADIKVVATCRNGREALNAVVKYTPDILFLDIQMPGMSGFDVVRRLQGDTIPMVVFATAYDHYAIEAFEVHAVDYILKPLEMERIELAVDRARARARQEDNARGSTRDHKAQLLASLQTAQPSSSTEGTKTVESSGKLAIKDRGRIVLLDQFEIEWIDAAGDYMCIHATGETHVMRSTLKDLQKQLSPDWFKRIHRSTLVNLKFIDQIKVLTKGEYLLTMKSGSEVKVSRNYRTPIKEYLEGTSANIS